MAQCTPPHRRKRAATSAPSRLILACSGILVIVAMLWQPTEQALHPVHLRAGAVPLRGLRTSKMPEAAALHLRGGSAAAETNTVCPMDHIDACFQRA